MSGNKDNTLESKINHHGARGIDLKSIVFREQTNYINKERLKLMHGKILIKVKNDQQYDNRKKY